MKRLSWLLLLALVLALSFSLSPVRPVQAAPAQANPAENDKPRTAILYYDHLIATASTKFEIENNYLTKLINKLSPSHNVVNGDQYIQKFKSIGIYDLTTAESEKIVPVFQPENIDYIIIIDIQRQRREYDDLQSDMIITYQNLKVIDVKNNRTLYNTKFSHASRHASPQKHVDELYKRSEEAILKVFQEKSLLPR